MNFKMLPITVLFLFITNVFAQNKGVVTFKNGDVKEGLIENKGNKILFYASESATPDKIAHEDIEHIKTGDIEYFRTSPKSKKLEEYQVMVSGETMLVARNIQTNYGSMKVEHNNTYVQNGNLTASQSIQVSRRVVRGPSNRGTIIKYYIKKPGANIEQVYRLIVGDVDWIGYKKKVKKQLGDCKELINKMNNGDFKDEEYGKGAELAAIVLFYNQNCGK
ncbi:hypothetical protein [Maribacter litoralis]|uniref:hypothetical protein n=1 Tax=Maribacter litoralis TaxID=2059726 RepID=UPI000E31D8B3|nr:hypothetical protein [Maribacter litoralis]